MHNSTNSLSSERIKPSRLVEKHVGLEDDEVVLLLAHKHWMVFRNSTLLALFCPFVLLFFVFFINTYPLYWSTEIIHWSTIGLFIASARSEEHTSELQSRENLVCRLLLEKKKKQE